MTQYYKVLCAFLGGGGEGDVLYSSNELKMKRDRFLLTDRTGIHRIVKQLYS